VDLSEFNPKAPPKKTKAFWEIVDANKPAENSDFAEAQDHLGNPEAVTLSQLANASSADLSEWLKAAKTAALSLIACATAATQ
jgi:hypothetical protein